MNPNITKFFGYIFLLKYFIYMQRFDLKRFRIDRKLTQKELAELLMCKQNYISNIENGIKPISKEKLDILQIFHITN